MTKHYKGNEGNSHPVQIRWVGIGDLMVRHILFTDKRGIHCSVHRVSCFSNRKSINCVGSPALIWASTAQAAGIKSFGVSRGLKYPSLRTLLSKYWADRLDTLGIINRRPLINHQTADKRGQLVTVRCVSASVQTIWAFMNKVFATKVRSAGGKIIFCHGIWLKNFASQSLWVTEQGWIFVVTSRAKMLENWLTSFPRRQFGPWSPRPRRGAWLWPSAPSPSSWSPAPRSRSASSSPQPENMKMKIIALCWNFSFYRGQEFVMDLNLILPEWI